MRTVEDYEKIRRTYFVDQQSIRAIHRTLGYDRETIRKAIVEAAPMPYTLEKPREAPVIGPYKQRIAELLKESKQQKRKQRYTAHRIFEILCGEGYTGSEGAVHNYVSRERRKDEYKEKYIPLEFDPGQDGQVDWGEADIILSEERVTVQFFTLRLNYSKARFVMAFPFQKQEAFFEGHNQAFRFFGGVLRRLTYDNLKTAVYKILSGRNRQEQESFKKFRSYYLFESNYCNPAQGHEKGGVENDVGYIQRNFMTPLLRVNSYEELNALLWKACQENLHRRVRGQSASVFDLLADERSLFLPMPMKLFPACTNSPVTPNGYCQVDLDTNRYSVPVEHGNDQLVMRAYPFRVEFLCGNDVIATHLRCFGHEQDVLDPLHYLNLLEQRPGAFEHAKPLRSWRKNWPKDYDRLLEAMRTRQPEGRGVKEFITVLKLHRDYPADQIEAAVHAALELGAASLDGVLLYLRQLQQPQPQPQLPTLDFERFANLATYGNQPVNLQQYDQLVAR
jgi:transposase